MHSSRMCTTRGSSHPRGGLHQAPPPPGRHTPLDLAPPWNQAPPREQTPPLGPGSPTGAGTPPEQTLPPLWTEFLTHPCPKLRLRAVINSLLGKKTDKNFTSLRKGFRLHAYLSHTKQPTFRKRKSM